MENNKIYIPHFKPKRKELNSASAVELGSFNAGVGYETFNDYIQGKDATEDAESGLGATQLIYDYSVSPPCIVSYFTICANVIPYDDGIDNDPDISEYPSIPVFEIKMFAVDEKYQDVFFVLDSEELPVSAWCLRYIIDYTIRLSKQTIGAQGLYLHAIQSAEKFYDLNGFSYICEEMHPLFSVDSNYKPMWMRILGNATEIEKQ